MFSVPPQICAVRAELKQVKRLGSCEFPMITNNTSTPQLIMLAAVASLTVKFGKAVNALAANAACCFEVVVATVIANLAILLELTMSAIIAYLAAILDSTMPTIAANFAVRLDVSMSAIVAHRAFRLLRVIVNALLPEKFSPWSYVIALARARTSRRIEWQFGHFRHDYCRAAAAVTSRRHGYSFLYPNIFI